MVRDPRIGTHGPLIAGFPGEILVFVHPRPWCHNDGGDNEWPFDAWRLKVLEVDIERGAVATQASTLQPDHLDHIQLAFEAVTAQM